MRIARRLIATFALIGAALFVGASAASAADSGWPRTALSTVHVVHTTAMDSGWPSGAPSDDRAPLT